MQQQRHVEGFIPFFLRENSHGTAILLLLPQHFRVCTAFPLRLALKSPRRLVKTLNSGKKPGNLPLSIRKIVPP